MFILTAMLCYQVSCAAVTLPREYATEQLCKEAGFRNGANALRDDNAKAQDGGLVWAGFRCLTK